MRRVLVAVLVVALAGCGGGSGVRKSEPVSLPSVFADAGEAPGSVDLELGTESATIDMSTPTEFNMRWLSGVLDGFGFPGGTMALMEQTRALDGTQTAEGDGVEARWTYHPDDGLSVVIVRSA